MHFRVLIGILILLAASCGATGKGKKRYGGPSGCTGRWKGPVSVDDYEPPPADARSLVVMSKNLYRGADLEPLAAAIALDDEDALVDAMSDAWAELEAGWVGLRMRAVALEIQEVEPDVIGLQEAARWLTQHPSDTFEETPTDASEVAYDLVEILLGELQALGLSYRVAAAHETLDLEYPREHEIGGYYVDVRLVDREVILVRNSAVTVEARAGHDFDSVRHVGDLEWTRGLAVIDLRHEQRLFRFVSAHLDEAAGVVRTEQLDQLDIFQHGTPATTILAVDFGTDLNAVDARPDRAAVEAYGFRLDAPGAVQGTALEGGIHAPSPQLAGLHNAVFTAFDNTGATAKNIRRLEPRRASNQGNLWSSDRAGVSVELGWVVWIYE